MSRSTAVVAFLLMALAAPADAQSGTRRRVAAGEVTGLEMGIEGSLSGYVGDQVRWYVTVYEVLRRRDLRPAANVELTVTTSYARDPVATVRTDANGRAALVIPMPMLEDDSGANLSVRVLARASRVERPFTVDLQLFRRRQVTLDTDRETLPPGGSVLAFGQATDPVDGAPIASAEVTLTTRANGAVVGAEQTVVTDENGAYLATLQLPDEEGELRLTASSEEARAHRPIHLVRRQTPVLWITAEPSRRVLAPGDQVPVRVRVRTPLGVPVQDARVRWAEDPDEVVRSDANGFATIPLSTPRVLHEPMVERSSQLEIIDPGRGTARHDVVTRVARVPYLFSVAVEGGALVPGLDGRVFVRAVTPDGLPAADVSLTLRSERLGGANQAVTDADGVAEIQAALTAGPSDACGGPTAVAATLELPGLQEPVCLPVAPDVSVRVVAGALEGAQLRAEVSRRADVARRPVELTVLSRIRDQWAPVAVTLVEPGRTDATLTLPDGARGELWLRARPVFELGRAARGGGDLVFRGPPRSPMDFDADASGAHPGGVGTTVSALVEPDRAPALRRSVLSPFGPVGLALDAGRSARYVQAMLAARTPRDEGASTVFREGELSAQPLPEDPAGLGLLRDPWRTRARFVRGRIGRLMRAVETYVDERIPLAMEDVSYRDGGRYRFNRSVLGAAVTYADLGEEGLTALDGEPLDTAALTALDPAFTYDNVARRLTRVRVFRASMFLRELVRSRELDLDRRFGLHGDPRDLLVDLLEHAPDDYWRADPPDRSDLFDGWGRPLVLRPARGTQSALSPLRGWKVVSAGPDGRAGTRDDIDDPFERVLPSGGLYADAVGEDALLARLNGVALGRATVESLNELFELPAVTVPDQEAQARALGWSPLPGPLGAPSAGAPLASWSSAIGGRRAVAFELPPERREYVAVGVRFLSGQVASVERRFVAGAPWSAHLELPTALHPQDRLRIPIQLMQLAEAEEPEIDVRVTGSALRARVAGRTVELEGVRPGSAEVQVSVRSEGRSVGLFSERVRVLPSGSLRARYAAGRTGGDGSVALSRAAPAGATFWRSELVVERAGSLSADPLLSRHREESPELALWAAAMTGADRDPVLVNLVRRRARARTDHSGQQLSSACALVGLAYFHEEDDPPEPSGIARGIRGSLPEDLSLRAAMLVALASAATSDPDSGGHELSGLIQELRHEGWRTLSSAPDQPSVMARMAAALLLVNREDVPARALFERARSRVETDAQGRSWVPGTESAADDRWVGTLALAIAARQLEEDELAGRLGDSALSQLYFAGRSGTEGAFWAIAAGVTGALGVASAESVEVTVNGRAETLPLDGGVARLDLADGASVQVRSESALIARVETRYVVPHRPHAHPALTADLEGTAGQLGGRSGYEVVVSNRSDETVAGPVIEIGLPSAGSVDDPMRRRLSELDTVLAVDAPDRAGVLRVHLAPIPSEGSARFALPLRWIAAGDTRGLSFTFYDRARPSVIGVTPDRSIAIEEGP